MIEDLFKAHVKGHVRGSVYVRPHERGVDHAPLEPHHHPRLGEKGEAVLVKQPHHPSSPSTWDSPDATATFVPEGDVPRELHGVPFRRWRDHPTTTEGWDYYEGIDDDLIEPPFKTKPGKAMASGVVIEEPDGRCWIVHPTNQFGGYHASWPKGGAEPGLSLQANACKEAFEESGLKIRITGFVGDWERTTSVARMYRAVRVGGSPTACGWESQAVSLIPKGDLYEHLHSEADHMIAEAVGAGPAPKQPQTGGNMGQKPMFGGLFGKK